VKTTVQYNDAEKTLVIITEFRNRLDYLSTGVRDIVRTHHCVAAGRALEDAVERGMHYSHTARAAEEYWDDAVLSSRNAVALITVFVLYYLAGTQPVGVSTEGAAWAMETQCGCRGLPGHAPGCSLYRGGE
jgi:hypothetical protein